MPFHFRIQGTRAQAIVALNAELVAQNNLDTLNLQLHDAAIAAFQSLLNTHNAIPLTYMDQGLVIDCHGHADEKSTRATFLMQECKIPGQGDISSSLPPASYNGALNP